LSRREQESARRLLKRKELLEEQIRGIPARLYYRVNIDKVGELLDSIRETGIPEYRQSYQLLVEKTGSSLLPEEGDQLHQQGGVVVSSRPAQFVPSTNSKEDVCKIHTTNDVCRSRTTIPSTGIETSIPRKIETHPAIEQHPQAISQILEELAFEDAQAVADELAGNVIASKIGRKVPLKNVYGWVHRLAKFSKKKAFFAECRTSDPSAKGDKKTQ
jgi:hypothetical protein